MRELTESYPIGTDRPNIIYSDEIASSRQDFPKRPLDEDGKLRKLDSIKKSVARGDSVKNLKRLNSNNSSVTVKKPLTRYEKFQAWMVNEGNRKIFFTFWILLHGLVFSMAFLNFLFSDNLSTARSIFGITYPIARSSALVLHVDAGLILFPVCRNLISLFRTTPLNAIIPFDENIEFHKAIGWSILFFSLLHTFSHWANFARLTIALNEDFIYFLKLNFLSGPGATGYVMLISLLIMVITATDNQRRRNFNRFWYLHHLFVPFFGAWAFHGAFCMIKPDRPPFCSDIAVFWKYWIASGTIYIGERILREIRARQNTYISKVVMHPSRVVEIQIKKKNIVTKAGQYIFLCCPAISILEWHPFTLTSAPEEDYISVHIRTVGDFTKTLAKKLGCDFEEEERLRKKAGSENRAKSTYDGVDISINSPELKKVLPRVMIDGPFGSASEDVFKFEVSILIGAGIGVTPFASILKSIWYRINYPKKSTKLRKVYFFWICRDYDSFEWFQSLLLAIEEQDIDQFIEIHTYLTARLRNSVIGNILVNDDGNIKDTITGLRAPTHYGRPNWDRIFSNMREQHPSTDVGVFFCGPKPLGKLLNNKCNLWSQGSEEGTNFVYGKGKNTFCLFLQVLIAYGNVFAVILNPSFEVLMLLDKSSKGALKKLNGLLHTITGENLELMPEYEQRIEVLKSLKYIDEKTSVVQLRGQISCKIVKKADNVTELIFGNVLKESEYDPAEIVALLSCLGVAEIKKVAKYVGEVQRKKNVDIQVDDYVETIKFGLVQVVYELARGMVNFLNFVIVDEIKSAAQLMGNIELCAKMDKARSFIKRDIVFATSLVSGMIIHDDIKSSFVII
nr:8673_t:CDS:10 [Entrophospora candida]